MGSPLQSAPGLGHTAEHRPPVHSHVGASVVVVVVGGSVVVVVVVVVSPGANVVVVVVDVVLVLVVVVDVVLVVVVVVGQNDNPVAEYPPLIETTQLISSVSLTHVIPLSLYVDCAYSLVIGTPTV